MFVSTVFFMLVLSIYAQNNLQSPCPALFTYDTFGGISNDRWWGTIRFTADAEYSGLWMRVIFDRPILEIETDYGEAVQRQSNEYLIRNRNEKITVGQTVEIKIMVKYTPNTDPPQLSGFRLNGRVICPESGTIETTTPQIPQLVSPCPEIFRYDSVRNESDRWYGTIEINSDDVLNGVWLRVILDRPSVQLGNWFGTVTTDDNVDYLIKNRQKVVTPGVAEKIRFFVKYDPADPIPQLTVIRLNAVTICSKGDSTSTSPQTIPTTNVQIPDRSVVGCGIVAAQPTPLVTYGESTVEGQWPWHAALYSAEGVDFRYICGGSLISPKRVLTAAHCVTRTRRTQPVNPSTIEIFLGKYSLRKFTGSSIQNIQVERIIVHPEYNSTSFFNDIAMIVLNTAAEYTNFVRPICLWNENNNLQSVIGREGTVVGWGFDENSKLTENLTKARMPIVSTETCFRSYPEFFAKHLYENSFCAGYKNGTSVCNGDSGGGLVFHKKNSNQIIWQIRGIVSIGAAMQTEPVCDPMHYVVFTDVSKYLNWIGQHLS